MAKKESYQEVFNNSSFGSELFRSAPIAISVFDENAEFIDCNDITLEMYGTTKENYRDNFFKLSPEFQPDGINSKKKLIEYMKRAVDGEYIRTEWLVLLSDNTPLPIELTFEGMVFNDKKHIVIFKYDLRHLKFLERSIDKLLEEVNIDSLTNVYNRSYFDKKMSSLYSDIPEKTKKNFSLLMIDVDCFKQYNDCYGHLKGDECLKQIAQVIKKGIQRTNDFVVRYGGEEFIVVLPYIKRRGANTVAKKIQKLLEKENILHENSKISDRVTLSIGVASATVDKNSSYQCLISEADKNLYNSKKSGRNKVTKKSK